MGLYNNAAPENYVLARGEVQRVGFSIGKDGRRKNDGKTIRSNIWKTIRGNNDNNILGQAKRNGV